MIEGRQGRRADVLSDSERFLLRAAGLLDAKLAAEAWAGFRELVREGDEETGEGRLLPLVCRNRLRLGLARDPYLHRAYAESFGATARIVRDAASAFEALRGASIRTMALKGTALTIAHYRDPGARPMSDVDILVPEARIIEALNALEAIGWRDSTSRAWLETPSHAGTVVSGSGTTIDLHRHATYEACFGSADNAFFEDAVPLVVSGVPTWAMSAGDQLLHVVIHGLRWSIARSTLWVLDAATILRSGLVDRVKTIKRAEKLRVLVPLERGLQTIRDVLGDEEALDRLLAELRGHSQASLRDRAEHWFRVREPAGLLGALPNNWFAYRRSDPEGRAPLSGFPSFLSRVWRLEPEGSLSRMVLTKIWRRVR